MLQQLYPMIVTDLKLYLSGDSGMNQKRYKLYEEIAKQKIYNSQRLIKYFGNQDGKLSLRAIERDSGCSINTVRKHFISWDKI